MSSHDNAMPPSMSIAVGQGRTVRPEKHVKAMQVIKQQRLELEAKRKVADEAEAVAYKEERRAIELNNLLSDAQSAFYSFQNELASRPLGLAGQPPKEVQRLEQLARNFGEWAGRRFGSRHGGMGAWPHGSIASLVAFDHHR